MKFGINHWTFPKGLSLRESFVLAKRAGCDSIEVNLAEEGELSLQSNEADVKALARAARDEGIEISSLSSGLYWSYPASSSDSAMRQKSLEVLQFQLRAASWLGVDTALVVPGRVTPEDSYDDVYDRARSFVEKGLPTAQETGVGIGLENVWNRFLLSPLETRDFVDGFKDPLVGVYFDAGNILAYGYPQHWIRILGHRIRRVHVKDFDDGLGGWTAFRNLLSGKVPWTEVRDALREVGYDGYITAEVEGYPAYPELGMRHIVECMREMLG